MEEVPKITTPLRPTTESNNNENSQPIDTLIKQKLIQRQLLLLLHAENCTLSSSKATNNDPNPKTCEQDVKYCTVHYCEAMKNVLSHLKSVHHPTQDLTSAGPTKCNFPYCYSSRVVLTHWKNCSQRIQEDHYELVKECVICGPATKLVFYNNHYTNVDDDKKEQRLGGLKRKFVSSEVSKHSEADDFNSKIWSGSLKWHKFPKSLNSEQQQVQPNLEIVPLNATLYSNHKEFLTNDISTANLHVSAAMKLIPTSILVKCGLKSQNAYKILFKLNDSKKEDEQSVAELKEILKAGRHAGYVHFEFDDDELESEKSRENFPIKVLFLNYDAEAGNFNGLIPMDQECFVKKLSVIIQGEKCKLQEMKRGQRNVNNGLEGGNHEGLV